MQRMKIGLISDTHDHVPMIERAAELFDREGVQLVFHAGDYVAPFSLGPLLNLSCPFKGVFGNNDGDRLLLQKISEGRISGDCLVEEVRGHKILVGHHFETLDALISSKQFSLIVYGHSHVPGVRKEGGTIAVNPGECCGWLYGKSTVAIVDLDRQEAEIITLGP